MFFLVLLLFVPQAANAKRTVAELCPLEVLDFFTHVELRTLNNTCYAFIYSDKSSYDDARKKCQHHNGTLAMPKTMEENEFLANELKTMGKAVVAWIGINDQETEGKMVYEDGSDVLLDTYFHSTTYGFESPEQDCVVLYAFDSSWRKYPCSQRSVIGLSFSSPGQSFICEYHVGVESENDDDDDDDDDDDEVEMPEEKDEEDKKAERPVSEVCPVEILDFFTHVTLAILNDTCYAYVYSDYSIYDDARKKCQQHNGTLAMPKTMEENDFLANELKTMGKSVVAWIGINDRETEGKMVYEDGSDVVLDNFHWATHGVGGGVEDCVALYAFDSSWHDYPCSHRSFLGLNFSPPKNPFICEYHVAT